MEELFSVYIHRPIKRPGAPRPTKEEAQLARWQQRILRYKIEILSGAYLEYESQNPWKTPASRRTSLERSIKDTQDLIDGLLKARAKAQKQKKHETED